MTDDHAVLRSAKGVGPYLLFLRTPDMKTVKNRVHLDLRPYPGDDQAAEVAQLPGAQGTRHRPRPGRRPVDVPRRPGGQRIRRPHPVLTRRISDMTIEMVLPIGVRGPTLIHHDHGRGPSAVELLPDLFH